MKKKNKKKVGNKSLKTKRQTNKNKTTTHLKPR